MSQRFTVTAERSGKWWTLESDNGAVSQTRTLAHAADEMREAVAWLAGLPESDVDIQVVISPPENYSRLRGAEGEYRRQADEYAKLAAEKQREAARTLVEDMSVRDAARVMGISHQRVQQLVSA